MATPEFPSTIIPPSQQGYEVQKPTGFVQSELQGGPARSQMDSIGTPYIVQATWECTKQQYVTISGFLRDRLQYGTRIFRIPLVIDVPTLIPYQARLLRSAEKLSSIRGLLYTVTAQLEVLPNPIVSFNLACQSVSDNRVIANNNPDFNTNMDLFPTGRQVQLYQCEGIVSGTFLNLDGTYTILGKPNATTITLQNAPAINPGWTTLNGTAAQLLFPAENAGACVLLPE